MTPEQYTLLTYVVYLLASVGLTYWVGRTLHHGGRIFLVDACQGKEDLADSVNRLLLVGFYLVNFGFVTLFMTNASETQDLLAVFRVLSVQVGTVLLVLGGMHFFNLFVLYRVRRGSRLRHMPVPTPPTLDLGANR